THAPRSGWGWFFIFFFSQLLVCFIWFIWVALSGDQDRRVVPPPCLRLCRHRYLLVRVCYSLCWPGHSCRNLLDNSLHGFSKKKRSLYCLLILHFRCTFWYRSAESWERDARNPCRYGLVREIILSFTVKAVRHLCVRLGHDPDLLRDFSPEWTPETVQLVFRRRWLGQRGAACGGFCTRR
ncbi:hypothetical protein CSUI_008615, partial [Cystoisospora suis]